MTWRMIGTFGGDTSSVCGFSHGRATDNERWLVANMNVFNAPLEETITSVGAQPRTETAKGS